MIDSREPELAVLGQGMNPMRKYHKSALCKRFNIKNVTPDLTSQILVSGELIKQGYPNPKLLRK